MMPSTIPPTPPCPWALAKATVEMSSAPNIDPRPIAMNAVAITPAGTRNPRPAVPTLRTGGSVRRSRSSKVSPMTFATTATTRPDAGCTAYAMAVAKAGPATKSTSSSAPSSEKAVWICSSESRMCDQRARVSDPRGPETEEMPAPSHSSHSGPRIIAVATSSTIPATKRTAKGIMARWPLRSMSLAVGSVWSAHTATPTAATRPAISHLPYWICTISVVEMPTVEIGRRARRPASANWRAPGRLKRAR